SACTDTAGRQGHYALEGSIVVTVRRETQVCECVLDFSAFDEPQATIDAIRDIGAQECFFEHPRLGVGAIQDGDLASRTAAFHPFADAAHHEIRLVALVERC